MKTKFCIIILVVLCLGSLQFAAAQEIRSGLLLTSIKNPKRTKVIPINRNVKIWSGEDNKVYYTKILAVDKEFAYLSWGVRIPIKGINCIKRKRIMLHDVGNATIATGAWAYDNITKEHIGYDWADSYHNNSNDTSLWVDLFFPVVSAVGVGVTYLTAGVAVGIFEPRYSAKKWKITPLNPEEYVVFQNYILNQKRR